MRSSMLFCTEHGRAVREDTFNTSVCTSGTDFMHRLRQSQAWMRLKKRAVSDNDRPSSVTWLRQLRHFDGTVSRCCVEKREPRYQ